MVGYFTVFKMKKIKMTKKNEIKEENIDFVATVTQLAQLHSYCDEVQ